VGRAAVGGALVEVDRGREGGREGRREDGGGREGGHMSGTDADVFFKELVLFSSSRLMRVAKHTDPPSLPPALPLPQVGVVSGMMHTQTGGTSLLRLPKSHVHDTPQGTRIYRKVMEKGGREGGRE
jgi:hypothetical protein